MSYSNPPPNFSRKPRILVRQVWRHTTPTIKSPPPSQNASPSPPPRVNFQSPSPPSHNPLRDQIINQLHNIPSILEFNTQNSSNVYSQAPPSSPSPLIHPATHDQVEKVVEDVGKYEDFKGGSWVNAFEFVNANGGIVNGCLGDIKNHLKNGKLEQVVAIIKSYTLNAFSDLIVTLKDLSCTIPGTIHHEVINEGDYGKDITDGRNVTDEEHQLRLDEEALILSLEEEAMDVRAEQEWLDKCRQEHEKDEKHERQL
ncbi:hypothetical protein Tco_0530717 [Tanacetum coccineum]